MIQELNIQITNGKLCDPEETRILIDENLGHIYGHNSYAKTVSNITFYNNNIGIKCIIVGDDDHEKAMLALGFVCEIAYQYSYNKYSSIQKWKEFFDMRKDTAIINPKDIMNLKKKARKNHHVYFLDDIGYAYSDDEWMENSDKIMNNIFNPCDNYNNCIIATIRSNKWMGCDASKLFNFHIENPHFEMIDHDTWKSEYK